MFPNRCVLWNYVRHLHKMFDEGERVAHAFVELCSANLDPKGANLEQ